MHIALQRHTKAMKGGISSKAWLHENRLGGDKHAHLRNMWMYAYACIASVLSPCCYSINLVGMVFAHDVLLLHTKCHHA